MPCIFTPVESENDWNNDSIASTAADVFKQSFLLILKDHRQTQINFLVGGRGCFHAFLLRDTE